MSQCQSYNWTCFKILVVDWQTELDDAIDVDLRNGDNKEDGENWQPKNDSSS